MRAGIIGVRTTPRRQELRGYYCGMGICWECAVAVEGVGIVRSCMFPASDGLVVQAPSAMTHEIE
jgi:predicted molibdopterin-dependent oxidoreductase YjgC